ncbi:MAG: pseudouridine-5'-phosphate glycosidase [Planctomycetota bacterium]
MSGIQVHPQVGRALESGRPVVALETAVATAGLPAIPLERSPRCDAPGWDAGGPANAEAARLLERVVRDAGAVPATVAVVDGVLRIGLDDEGLSRLLAGDAGAKASARDLASVMAGGRTAGTTVSATLLACLRAVPAPIRVLATGGIGGVHRGWAEHPDVSCDLRQLATSPVCVVASGAKSMLDVPATVEVLETLGIPVIGYRADRFPRFYGSPAEGLPAPRRVENAQEVAEVCQTHWRTLGCSTGVLLASPPPGGQGLEEAEIEPLVAEAEAEARRRGITGGARTPYVLSAVASGTGGRAVDANIALLAANARLAAAVAEALCTMGR